MFGLTLYARVVFAVIIALVLAMSHWKVYVMGKHTVQAEWNVEKLAQAEQLAAAEKAARAREQQLVQAKTEAEEKYAQIKKQVSVAVAGARAELDRLRYDLAARDVPGAGQTAAAGARVDAGSVERQLLGTCATEYTGMAGEVEGLRAQLIGLQDYVNNVCQYKTGRP